jgi:hypothetical protein
VEVGDGRVLLRQVVVPTDDAAAIPHDAYNAAVLPVADLLLVGALQELQQLPALLLLFGHLLDLGHEGGPCALLQLVQKGSAFTVLLCHPDLLSTV